MAITTLTMGCSGCSSNNGLPAGCRNNGTCGTYGCNKLDVFDWLAGLAAPDGQKPFDVSEVRFKNSRKAFFRNPQGIELFQGDIVVVEASPGFDVGVVSITGELVRMQMRKKDIRDNYEIRKILRKARPEDIEKWQEARKREQETMMKARQMARSLDLQMKISDVEFQGDGTKATFFYTADDRVDFRELIKRYAEDFRVRIEMRQVGLRVEAGRLGGIGSCGRELCCSTWLTDFRAVSTSAARYQQLSLNPAKLAGQCGKLKCCLNYELDQYVEALKDLPSSNVRLRLPKGTALHLKTDIFRRTMFYIYENQPGEPPIALTVDAVKEIMDKNRKGVEIEDMGSFTVSKEAEKDMDFAEVVGQDSLTRFDKKKQGNRSSKGRTRDRKPDGNRPQRSGPPSQGQRNEPKGPARPENKGDNKGAARPPRQEPKPGGSPEQKGRPPQQGQGPRKAGPPRRNPPKGNSNPGKEEGGQ